MSKEKDFYQAIINIETEDECERFLWDLLTPHELEIQVKRWQIVLKLSEEENKDPEERKTYGQIADELGIDAATVSKTVRYFTGRDTRHGFSDILHKIKSMD